MPVYTRYLRHTGAAIPRDAELYTREARHGLSSPDSDNQVRTSQIRNEVRTAQQEEASLEWKRAFPLAPISSVGDEDARHHQLLHSLGLDSIAAPIATALTPDVMPRDR